MTRLTAAQQRADIALAATLFAGAVLSAMLTAVAGFYGNEQADLGWAVGYAVGLALPLAVRRRWPATVAVVVSVAYFVAVTLRVPEIYAGNIAMFIALYTVGAWSSHRRRATVVRVGIISGMFLWLMIVMYQDATLPAEEIVAGGFSRAGAFSPYVAYSLLTLLINVLYFAGAYYFGGRAYAQRAAWQALQERTAELEHAREVSAAQAVALDRVRIARELHDVVAHHVSVMGVQAGAARAVMSANPAQAGSILEGVESSARDALAELRHLLETLRTPDAEADTGGVAPGLSALPRLVEEASAAGLPTTFTVIGQPADVPEVVQVNLYRIAQEALTNARRHAGPGAAADVRVRFDHGAVELEVANTGRVGTLRPGLGQLGMRERAAASGGTIEMGPRPRGGGYLVRARIPRRTEVAVDA